MRGPRMAPYLEVDVSMEQAWKAAAGAQTAPVEAGGRVRDDAWSAVLGLLEFIDWGGGDILYYASRYLSSELGERYRAPEIVERNMHEGRNGLRDGEGFYDWKSSDVAAYRERRLGDFSRMLTHAGLLPQPGAARAIERP